MESFGQESFLPPKVDLYDDSTNMSGTLKRQLHTQKLQGRDSDTTDGTSYENTAQKLEKIMLESLNPYQKTYDIRGLEFGYQYHKNTLFFFVCFLFLPVFFGILCKRITNHKTKIGKFGNCQNYLPRHKLLKYYCCVNGYQRGETRLCFSGNICILCVVCCAFLCFFCPISGLQSQKKKRKRKRHRNTHTHIYIYIYI